MQYQTRAEQSAAQWRHRAVRMYRAGTHVKDIAWKLKRSPSWVYKWIRYQTGHPWTRFRSGSRAPQHHPNQTSRSVARRLLHLRRQLVRGASPQLRFAGIGARTIQREYRKHYGTPPSLSTIQRLLKRHHCVKRAARQRPPYRPHPAAAYPNAVQATDIITRWITGGLVVQTFNTVDIFSNDVASTTHADKTARAAVQHLLQTWETLGIPDLAQFDNESAFSGGRHARSISQVVRLCLYVGIPVLFTPLGEASYNWPAEVFNDLWAHQFWNRHQFRRRGDIPRVQRAFLEWYRHEYIAPRQPATPAHLRRGHRILRLSARDVEQLPNPLPICAGQIHAVRRVLDTGFVSFLNSPVRVGKQYAGRYVWLTLETAPQNLTIWYQPRADAPWRQLKQLAFPLKETVVPVSKPFARLHH